MKRLINLVFYFVCLMTIGIFANQYQAYAQKIVYVNSDEVLKAMEEWKAIPVKLDSLFSAERLVLELREVKLREDYEYLLELLEKCRDGPGCRHQIEKVGKQSVKLQKDKNDFQNRIYKKQIDLEEEVKDILKDIIKGFAIEKGYTYVLDDKAGMPLSLTGVKQDVTENLKELILNR